MPTKNEPMATIIARAIYEQPTANGTPPRDFDNVSSDRQAQWIADADRVIAALRKSMGYAFQEFAYEMGGAEWLAVTPRELWEDFLDDAAKGGPNPNRGACVECKSDNADERCVGCNCWKDAMANCS